MPDARLLERLWWGTSPAARAGRALLLPLEFIYRGAVSMRGALYDAGVLPSRAPALPALSVGNIAVGGTGKTPVAALLATRLHERGARPALVLRGYGDDEPLVHARLNPDVPVVVAPDRLAGIARAAAAGADVAVLDDAFQHRRARRSADVVLVSAERWTRRPRLLPAGPWRESLRALQRASMVLITRKSATAAEADVVSRDLDRLLPNITHGIVHLALADLHQVDGGELLPLEALGGARVLAISAIGEPGAFVRQLEEQVSRGRGGCVRAWSLPDHHPFTAAAAARIAEALEPGELAVCTLKDAVKLGPVWPRAASPLWYVSQRPTIERGAASIDVLLTRVLDARHPPC
ncbi:MAG TPA: tetraacyldisaccharide 4'-kinase [Gemmatimonadaceae bacterium]